MLCCSCSHHPGVHCRLRGGELGVLRCRPGAVLKGGDDVIPGHSRSLRCKPLRACRDLLHLVCNPLPNLLELHLCPSCVVDVCVRSSSSSSPASTRTRA